MFSHESGWGVVPAGYEQSVSPNYPAIPTFRWRRPAFAPLSAYLEQTAIFDACDLETRLYGHTGPMLNSKDNQLAAQQHAPVLPCARDPFSVYKPVPGFGPTNYVLNSSGVNVLRCDESVVLVAGTIDAATWIALATRAGGDIDVLP